MKFEDMPVNIQEKAASTLSDVIASIKPPEKGELDQDRFQNTCQMAAEGVANAFVIMSAFEVAQGEGNSDNVEKSHHSELISKVKQVIDQFQ